MCATKTLKYPSTLRRQPSQLRSQHTINTIFQATTHIISRDGEAALTTNKIAEKAGFSVGTLYQYFPSKEAIVAALIARERQRVIEEIAEFIEKILLHSSDLPATLQSYVQMLVRSFAGGIPSRKLLCRIGWRVDHEREIAPSIREMTDRISVALSRIDTSSAALKLRIQPVTLFVVTRAILGVIRSASLEKSALLDSSEFEAELARLACSMLLEKRV
jgi:AcrR family transcriptional regulator